MIRRPTVSCFQWDSGAALFAFLIRTLAARTTSKKMPIPTPGAAVAMSSACERGHEMLGRSQPSVSRQPGAGPKLLHVAAEGRSPRTVMAPPACFAELGCHRPDVRILDLQQTQ